MVWHHPVISHQVHRAWSHRTRREQGRYATSLFDSLHFVGFPFASSRTMKVLTNCIVSYDFCFISPTLFSHAPAFIFGRSSSELLFLPFSVSFLHADDLLTACDTSATPHTKVPSTSAIHPPPPLFRALHKCMHCILACPCAIYTICAFHLFYDHARGLMGMTPVYRLIMTWKKGSLIHNG